MSTKNRVVFYIIRRNLADEIFSNAYTAELSSKNNDARGVTGAQSGSFNSKYEKKNECFFHKKSSDQKKKK